MLEKVLILLMKLILKDMHIKRENSSIQRLNSENSNEMQILNNDKENNNDIN